MNTEVILPYTDSVRNRQTKKKDRPASGAGRPAPGFVLSILTGSFLPVRYGKSIAQKIFFADRKCLFKNLSFSCKPWKAFRLSCSLFLRG